MVLVKITIQKKASTFRGGGLNNSDLHCRSARGGGSNSTVSRGLLNAAYLRSLDWVTRHAVLNWLPLDCLVEVLAVMGPDELLGGRNGNVKPVKRYIRPILMKDKPDYIVSAPVPPRKFVQTKLDDYIKGARLRQPRNLPRGVGGKKHSGIRCIVKPIA